MSCLPRSAVTLRRARRFTSVLDNVVGLDNYQSVTDAVLVALVPEMREPMRRFYDADGPALNKLLDAGALGRLDERITRLVEQSAALSSEQLREMLLILGAW